MFVLPRWIRALSSGMGFTLFGIGSVVLVAIGFPIVRLTTRDRQERVRRIRLLIERSFRLFIRALIGLGAISVSFKDRERLASPGPLLIVANHPSLIDVCLLVSWIPDADCVVKREAWSNPFLGGVMRAADYIPNDGGESLIETCAERLARGGTLVLFPEGTRSPKGELRNFKRGAARIALKADCPVLLVDIDCRPPFLGKGDPWYRVPAKLPCYTVTVHEPVEIATHGGVAAASEASEARRVSALWREGFKERLGHV